MTGDRDHHGEFGTFPDDQAAVVAGVVIETREGQGPFVACRLEGVGGLEIVGGDGNRRLAAVWSAPSGKSLTRAVEQLLERDEDVIGVFPTFIGRDEGEAGEPEARARSGALESIVSAAEVEGKAE